MKLLIAGANGQLGKEWIDFCSQNQIDYTAYNSNQLDITNALRMQDKLEIDKPDAVINCAAYTKVDDAEENIELAKSINADAVKELATLCFSRNIKLVHYSTDYVFSGSEKDFKAFPDGYLEDHGKNPINAYGKSKANGEAALIDSGCSFLLIRISWLCGKHGNNFVKTMLWLGQNRNELSVVNDQLGSPSFCHKVVSDTYQLLANKYEGVFHSTSEGVISWYDFAIKIFEMKELDVNVHPISTDQFPTKAKRPVFSKLSTEKISNIPGVKKEDWKTGLKKLLAEL